MSNGSERAAYVPMAHVFKRLRRPHRAVNVMFTYYPFDKGWPKRARFVKPWKPGMHQWDLPFDDYEPFTGVVEGDPDAEALRQFRDVRRFGSDVHLTLTIDLKTPVRQLRAIARALRPYGRLFIRINHECNGFWFQHNKRYSYRQCSRFFVRFHNILREEAPLVRTVLCLNGMHDATGEARQMRLRETELNDAVRTADIIGVDRYFSLFTAYPNAWTGEPGTYYDDTIAGWWKILSACYRLVRDVRGDRFPYTLPEMNADGDVNGRYGQATRIRQMYDLVRTQKEIPVSALTFYQFRDQGKLGLEREDPETGARAGTYPAMAAYRRAVDHDFYLPGVNVQGAALQPRPGMKLRWWHSEKAEGLAIKGVRPAGTARLQLIVPRGTYLVHCNRRWFHVDRAARLCLDRVVAPGERFELALFCPPENGENDTAPDGSYRDRYTRTLPGIPEPRPA
jgi:hypothetical protein